MYRGGVILRKNNIKKWCSLFLSISIILSIFINKEVYAYETNIDNNGVLKINEISEDEIYFYNEYTKSNVFIKIDKENNSFTLTTNGNEDYYQINENGEFIKNTFEKIGEIDTSLSSNTKLLNPLYETQSSDEIILDRKSTVTKEAIRTGAIVGFLGLIMGGPIVWSVVAGALTSFFIGVGVSLFNYSGNNVYLAIYARYSATYDLVKGTYTTTYKKRVSAYKNSMYNTEAFLYRTNLDINSVTKRIDY